MIDRNVAMGTILTRVLWLQGHAEQAEEAARQAVERARREGESVGLAYALAAAACPVALWTGRIDVARERVSLLLRHTAEHSLGSWRRYGVAFEALLDWHEQGCAGEGPGLPVSLGLDQRVTQFNELLATLNPAWATEETFSRGDSGDAGWCQAELLRIRAERVDDSALAEDLLLRSLQRARIDGAAAWELRTTTSLARRWQAQGRSREAFELLDAALRRMSEGRTTRDALSAQALHDVLSEVRSRRT